MRWPSRRDVDLERVEVVENPERRRFEVRDGRTVLGWTTFEETSQLVVFHHTEVKPRWEGTGLGSKLVRATLDHVRDQGKTVLPLCSFVDEWIERHPDYADLVYDPSKPSSTPTG
ncbi:GNAT family N-acetyltransferase [Propioniciclava sinopodophylli]|uniref:GNAT family N-acetyltransferase n=1 Tax=Propioniciclava sinopodophylli TaxID=1837344 RepID=UPI002490C2E0|nr:GNAT family N-acetyltransferase [Propioniciclava sinopodophylli]